METVDVTDTVVEGGIRGWLLKNNWGFSGCLNGHDLYNFGSGAATQP